MSSVRWFLATFLVWIIISAQESLSAQFERQYESILLVGEIVEGDIDRLKSTLKRYGNLRIDLNSGGGSLGEALQLGAFIRSKGLATHIPKGATCASACVTIFAGGLMRTAHPKSRIGIHMASGVFNDPFIDAMDNVIREYGVKATPYIVAMFEESAAKAMLQQVYFILESGVSLTLLQAITLVPHDEIYWLSRNDAISVNLINYH